MSDYRVSAVHKNVTTNSDDYRLQEYYRATSVGLAHHHDEGNGLLVRVTQADLPGCQAEISGEACSIAVQQQDRPPTLVAVHFDLGPAYHADARAKCFRRCLFSRDARRQSVRLVLAFAAFLGGKQARVEPFAVTFGTAGDSRHVHQVYAYPQHLLNSQLIPVIRSHARPRLAHTPL